VGAWAEDEAKPFNKAQSLQGKPREHGCQKATFYRWTQTRSDDDVSRRMRVWGRVNKHEIAEVGRVRQIQVAEVNDADRPNIYRVTDETGKRYPMTAEELRMSVNQPIPDAMPMTPENRVHSGDTEVSIYGSQVTFTGRGWGHGIGMCQWCAKGFADLGWDWRKMIRTFYPGSEVQKVY
jgi:SpoIID/LytB domain protein